MTEAAVQEYAGSPEELYEELTEIERRFEDVEVDLRMLMMGAFFIYRILSLVSYWLPKPPSQ